LAIIVLGIASVMVCLHSWEVIYRDLVA
jgi:hypothetical protein